MAVGTTLELAFARRMSPRIAGVPGVAGDANIGIFLFL